MTIKARFFNTLAACASLLLALVNHGCAAPSAVKAAGPFPAEVSAWNDAEKDRQRAAAEQLILTIEAALKNGDASLVIPKDDYRFAGTRKTPWGGPAHLIINKPKNIVIDFQGSTLWFENGATGLALFGARNVTLKNVFLDWDPLPFFQGVVTAIDPVAGTFDFRPDPGYERERTSTGIRDKDGSNDWRGIVFDAATRELKAGMGGFSVGFYWENRQPNGDYRVKFRGFHDVPVSATSLAVGDPMVILARIDRAFRLDGSVDCTFQDVTLYSSPFVCVDQKTGSGTTFRRVNILLRPGTDRLLAGNADGINCGNMLSGPLIEDCRMETLGDDFINIHGHFSRALHQENPTTILVSQMNNRGDIGSDLLPLTVEFFERSTMKPLGARRVLAVKLSQWTPRRGATIADLDHRWWSGQAAGLAYDRSAYVHRLTLDEPVDFAVGSDVIVSVEALSTPDTVIRNNHFSGSIARGMLLHSPRVLVEGNTMERTSHAGIYVTSEGSYWGEGPYAHTVTLRGNTIRDAGINLGGHGDGIVVEQPNPELYQFQHDIRIEQNTVENTGGAGIRVAGVRNLVVTGNTIRGNASFGPALNPEKARQNGTRHALALQSIRGLVLEGNTVEKPGPWSQGEIHQADVEIGSASQQP